MKRNHGTILIPAALIVLGLTIPSTARSQEIVDEALQDFPARTGRLEYVNSAELRALKDYDALRQRYLGADLQRVEKSLAKLGIEEKEVDELVLGWPAVVPGKSSGAGGLFGLAGGHFRGDAIASQAAGWGCGRHASARAKPIAPALTTAASVLFCLMTRAAPSAV